jgi:hypothetical protein
MQASSARDPVRQQAVPAVFPGFRQEAKIFSKESNPWSIQPRMLIDNLIRTDRKRTDDISRGEARRKS